MQTVKRYAAWMDLVGVLILLAAVALGGCSKASQPATDATSDVSSTSLSSGPTTRLGIDGPDEKFPVVELRTSLGTLTLKLDTDSAPETVHNFMSYVASGHYNGTIFHQVEKGYALLGGGYTPDLAERQGRYPIRNEAANGRKNLRGTVAMARRIEEIDSATCQFIINLDNNSSLDHEGDTPDAFGFCVFGEVVDGLDVLQKIASVPVQDSGSFPNLPTQTVVIESARRLR
ncbi:MAG TPA: peptidylprolyl isomerase [Pirellulales bacterium]|jgi:cyclophilin family peptidyl-prolyl cis-trans isomerase|nr:peptidylprolyl isomerase [Pirellulales bacterium]